MPHLRSAFIKGVFVGGGVAENQTSKRLSPGRTIQMWLWIKKKPTRAFRLMTNISRRTSLPYKQPSDNPYFTTKDWSENGGTGLKTANGQSDRNDHYHSFGLDHHD